MNAPVVARRIARAVADTDLAAVRWMVPLRAAVVTTVVVGVMMALGYTTQVVPVAIGLVFAGVGDARGALVMRAKGMGYITVGITVAAVLGVLASGQPVLRIAGTVVVALICGYAGRLGPRSAMVGLLSLIVFIVFAGVPEAATSAVQVGLLMLAGGAIQIAVALVPQLVWRSSGVRGDVCVAYRAVAYSVRTTRIRYGGGSPALKVEQARRAVAAMRADPGMQRPLDALLDALTRFRIGGLIVLSLPVELDPAERQRLDAFRLAAADLALAIGHAVELRPRRGSLPERAAAMESAATDCEGISDAGLAVGIAQMRRGLRDALEVMEDGVPRGSAQLVPFDMTVAQEPMGALLGRATLDDVMLRHALRLALATGAGTVIAVAWSLPHGYWIPMTVAWVLRPDLAGTGVRVAARLAGTLIGLAVVLAVIGIFGNGPVPVLAVLFASAVLVYAYIVPNYSLCTAGVTMFVIALYSYLGQPLVEDVGLRMLGTAAAGVLALGAVYVIRSRTTEVIAAALGRTAADLGRYAQLVRAGAAPADIDVARTHLAEARVTAGQVVEAAATETTHHRVHPDSAMRVLTDIVQAAAVVAAADVGGDAAAARSVPERVVQEADDLARRLEARDADLPVPPRALPPADGDDHVAVRLLDDAQRALDEAPTPLAATP